MDQLEDALSKLYGLCMSEAVRSRNTALSQFVGYLHIAREVGTSGDDGSAHSKQLAHIIEDILSDAHPSDPACPILLAFASAKEPVSNRMKPILDYCAREHSKPDTTRWGTIRRYRPSECLLADPEVDHLPAPNSASLDWSANTLYDILQKHKVCECKSSGTTEKHKGLLQLQALSHGESRDPMYRTVFARCCSRNHPEPEWSRLQFQTIDSKVRTPRKSARFGYSPQRNSPMSPKAQPIPTPPLNHKTDICKVLQLDDGPVYLCLRANADGTLHHQDPHLPAQYDYIPGHGKSLSSILTNYDLSSADRLHLAHIVATGFWQFYGTKWMTRRWTGHDISFPRGQSLITKSSSEDFDTLSPFVNMRLEESCPEPTSWFDEEFVVENLRALCRTPRILALGVILVGIFWRPIASLTNPPSTVNFLELNKEFLQGREQSKQELTWALSSTALDARLGIPDRLRGIVGACFQKDYLNNESLTAQDRREFLYEKVVAPLATIIQETGLKQEQTLLVSSLEYRDNYVDFTQSSNGSMSAAKRITPDVWISNITNSLLVENIKQFSGNGKQLKRTRIAILDTGYDPECVFFKNAERKRIKVWKDYVVQAEKTTKACDESVTGHGTFVLTLAMRLAERADFYVARIARDSSDISSESVAKAIKWAAEEHRVDIVSMSFGFEHDKTDIQDAIDAAYKNRGHRILFFAAASNQGYNTPEPDFPARHPRVFAVHATDHYGKRARFDTSSCRNSIATLGEDITSYVSRKAQQSNHWIHAEQQDSGTSFSTPIAASIAALVLDAAKVDSSGASRTLNGLRQFEGMKAMLLKLGSPTISHHYLDPIKWLRRAESERRVVMEAACLVAEAKLMREPAEGA